jgi:hypothetical protein
MHRREFTIVRYLLHGILSLVFSNAPSYFTATSRALSFGKRWSSTAVVLPLPIIRFLLFSFVASTSFVSSKNLTEWVPFCRALIEQALRQKTHRIHILILCNTSTLPPLQITPLQPPLHSISPHRTDCITTQLSVFRPKEVCCPPCLSCLSYLIQRPSVHLCLLLLRLMNRTTPPSLPPWTRCILRGEL